ncbi:spore coat protein CotJB [Paenibacillus thermoaerophilus]|jgi:spore coat protein JB|uniref:Spore coat protein CotJB n=1 Tax=Paenibacillus thermoaerophilus TaxID=1215385 RepID=A0ABW2UY14_9BACL|nr:spore coat protein CotJB [Paenibacillus thermoaerophilus]TMV19185.1 spore coat protein CotJB [Paenibacillus thermoaerophilus]
MKAVDNQYYQMLLEIQTIDFVLVELTLYLDTHPWDTQALQQFNQFAQARKPIVQAFEAAYGPLSGFGTSVEVGETWRWSQTPWPWQV